MRTQRCTMRLTTSQFLWFNDSGESQQSGDCTMRVTCAVFRATRLCLVTALWIAASGCEFEIPSDPSSTSDTSATKSNAAAPQTESLSSASQPPIKLSVGVALPQTGPTGTLMSFSMDYQFTQSGPDPTAKYVWVIERSQGDPYQRPVQLNGKGTLQILIPGWRPGEGPFQSHIAEIFDEEDLGKVSGSIALQ
jgi:hypothetical protein